MDEKVISPNQENERLFTIIALCIIFFIFIFPPLAIVLGFAFICVLCGRDVTAASQNEISQPDAIIIEEIQPIDESSDAYSIPTFCPTCGKRIEMNSIRWIDATTGICPSCESIIQAN
ncbi:MAG: hypothetical protein ACFFED_04780 [Candidatus Thorarchaeota archaeon]